MEMLVNFLVAALGILVLLSGWIFVQHITRGYSERHPEFGPAREEGGGCGGLFCLCQNGQDCPKEKLKQAIRRKHPH